MPQKIVPPVEDASITHTELTLEREKLELEKERLALERERLGADRERMQLEAETGPGSKGRVAISPVTILLAALFCCAVGAIIAAALVWQRYSLALQNTRTELELRSLSTTNEQGEVQSIFYVQPVEAAGSRIIID